MKITDKQAATILELLESDLKLLAMRIDDARLVFPNAGERTAEKLTEFLETVEAMLLPIGLRCTADYLDMLIKRKGGEK